MVARKVNFFQQLNDARKYAKDNVNKELFDSLTAIERYVKSGRYCQIPPDEYQAFYNVRLVKQSDAAEALNTSVGSFNFKKGRLSRKLYSLFGDDIFSLVYEVDGPEQILARLKNVGDSRKSNDVVLKQFIDSTKSHNVNGDYELEDCEIEIKLLTRYSKVFLDSSIDRVDVDKLSYLISLLDGEVLKVDDRNVLYELLTNGKVSRVSSAISLTNQGIDEE